MNKYERIGIVLVSLTVCFMILAGLQPITLEEGKCYDAYENEINNLTCQEKIYSDKYFIYLFLTTGCLFGAFVCAMESLIYNWKN